MLSIGKKLRALIEKNNIKQSVMASRLGLTPSRLSNYLSDKREPDIELLAKMAKYLNVDLNYFTDIKFPGKKSPSSDDPEMGSVEVPYPVSTETVDVSYKPVLTKNKKQHSDVIALNRLFIKDIEDPARNAAIFEIDENLPSHGIKVGDLVLAAKFGSVDIKNGSMLIDTKNNGKIYYYMCNKNGNLLVSQKNNEIIKLSDAKLANYYIIILVIKKM